MELNRWKLVAGGAALVGASIGAVAVADSDGDNPFGLNERAAIALADEARGAGIGPSDVVDDGSPESADSPNESFVDSADSPFDSPDDPGWVDPSPESADSPNESAQDSPIPALPPAPAPVSPDSPPPFSAPESVDSPAPVPAPASVDSPAPVPAPESVSFDSPDSGAS